MAFITLPELPPCDEETLARCVREVVERQLRDAASGGAEPTGHLPSLDRLARGAAKLAAEGEELDEEAARFDALVELCYLVALADELSVEERSAMADLVSHLAGGALAAAQVDALFGRYGERLKRDGLAARVDAVAAPFTDFLAREEAMSFAALVAIADRSLAGKEAVMLLALSNRFEQSRGEVQLIVDQVAGALRAAIERAAGA